MIKKNIHKIINYIWKTNFNKLIINFKMEENKFNKNFLKRIIKIILLVMLIKIIIIKKIKMLFNNKINLKVNSQIFNYLIKMKLIYRLLKILLLKTIIIIQKVLDKYYYQI